jgi:hypothetical protein
VLNDSALADASKIRLFKNGLTLVSIQLSVAAGVAGLYAHPLDPEVDVLIQRVKVI